mmetsp:Transcript_53046/g.123981  ORF Transcript_53046/g.123981 Transcript_53046/m.123981 type:complete len:148 (+) Transcript_53046:988-1431(+)
MNEPSWFGGAVNWTNFSHSLHTAGVDVMLTGHQHNYQRFLPSFSPDGVTTSWDLEQASNATYVDPLYMVTVVVGSPGCTEKIAKGFKFPPYAPMSREEYGFGHLRALNATHLEWDWQEIDPSHPGGATTVDNLVIVQHRHGPRPLHT